MAINFLIKKNWKRQVQDGIFTISYYIGKSYLIYLNNNILQNLILNWEILVGKLGKTG